MFYGVEHCLAGPCRNQGFTLCDASKLLASSCFSVFRIQCPHPLNPPSADEVLIGVAVALPFSREAARERVAHLYAVRVRLGPLCSFQSLSEQDLWRERRREQESKRSWNQKGKSSPLITLIWVLTLLWFEVVKPYAEEDGMLTQASSLLGPLLHGSETRRINERVGKRKRRSAHRQSRETLFNAPSVSWWPSGLHQPLFNAADHFLIYNFVADMLGGSPPP